MKITSILCALDFLARGKHFVLLFEYVQKHNTYTHTHTGWLQQERRHIAAVINLSI